MSVDLAFEVIDETSGTPAVETRRYAALTRYVLDCGQVDGTWDVTVALVDDKRLRALHAQFMGSDTVTDVMTFPRADDDPVHGGEIIISADRAAEQGPDHGLSRDDEIRFLLVHGLLHLCGWDDTTPEERDAMLARQTALLAGFDADGGGD